MLKSYLSVNQRETCERIAVHFSTLNLNIGHLPNQAQQISNFLKMKLLKIIISIICITIDTFMYPLS